MITIKKGSSLLMVLLIISCMSVLAMTVWRTTTYNIDIALLRAQEQQLFNVCDGLLTIGLSIAQENFDQLLERGDPLQIPTEQLMKSDLHALEHSLEIKPYQDELQILATAGSNGQSKTLTCFIARRFNNKNDKPFFIVQNWRDQAAKSS